MLELDFRGRHYILSNGVIKTSFHKSETDGDIYFFIWSVKAVGFFDQVLYCTRDVHDACDAYDELKALIVRLEDDNV